MNDIYVMIIREIVESILEGVKETKESDDYGELQQGILIGYYDSLISIREEVETNGIDLKDVLLDFNIEDIVSD